MHQVLRFFVFVILLVNCRPQTLSKKVTESLPPKIILADSLIQVGKLEEGARIYDSVLVKKKAGGAFTEYVHFQTRLANFFNKARQQDKAIDRLSRAIQIGEQHLDNQVDTFLANAYHNRGFNYYDTDNFEEAIKNLTAALAIQKRVLPPDHPHIIKGLLIIGDSHLFNGHYHEAIETLKAILNNPGEVPLATENQVLEMIGFSFGEIGEVDLAEKYLNILLSRYQGTEQSYSREIADVYKSLAGIASSKKEYNKAINHINEALYVYQELENQAINDSLALAFILNDAGLIYTEMDSNQTALSYYLHSKSLMEKYDSHVDLGLEIAQAMNNISVAYSEIGNYTLALDYQFAALKIYQEENMVNDIAKCQHNIGCYYEDTDRFTLALKYHQKALQNSISGFNKDHLYALPELSEINPRAIIIPKYLAFKGKTFWRKYLSEKKLDDLIAAYDTYTLCSGFNP